MPPEPITKRPASAGEWMTILSVTPHDSDHVFLEHAFSHSNWKVHRVRSLQEAMEWFQQKHAPVVLCEKDLPDACWKEALEQVNKLPHPPVLVVTSRLADDALWMQVLSEGAYDLLMKPFDTAEVFRVVSLGWRHWNQRVAGTNLKATA